MLALCLVSCGDDGPVKAADYGAQLFADPGFSDSQFNSFSCQTCHGESDDAPRVAGGLEGVVQRKSWWGGYSPRLIDAVNVCFELFMRGAPLDEADPRGRALYEYLVSISPAPAQPERPLTFVENVAPLPKGDPVRGRDVYNHVCHECHGAPHSGYQRLARSVAIIPEASIGFALDLKVDPGLVVVEKVRHGRFFGVGGTMPPFAREALSDADLSAVVAYLGL